MRACVLVRVISAIALTTALTVKPALAAGECRDQDSERQIAACTREIDSGAAHGKALAEAYIFRARGWSRIGDFDRAITDYNEAIRVDPTSAAAVNGRAIALYRKREFDRAIADFEAATRLNPKDGAIRCNLGTVWRDKGDFDRAIIEYTEAIRIDARVTICFGKRGEAWRLKGDLDRALVDQDQAVKTNPTIALAYVERGDTLRYKGEFRRALADYDHALQLEAEYVPALTGKGLTYEKIGDLAGARSEFEKALASHHRLAQVDTHRTARETASAQLAALASGMPLPVIPLAPSKAASATAIPTPVATLPAAPSSGVHHARRVALVIGNSAYKNATALPNPQHDAEVIAGALRAIGFDLVTLVQDATHQTLIDALRTFAGEVESADWAVVYYAGHGIEVGGVNFLVPVDAKIALDRDVQFEAVRLDQIMSSVDSARKLKMILLDACRNNPFVAQTRPSSAPDAAARTPGAGASGTRSIGRGLAEVKVSGATLVVYAAKHGQVALDGQGGNSPFAVAVVQRLATPGVEINKLFRLVRDDVMEATAGRQEPFTYGSLPGREDFFFVER
jgi:tetratricopeptide (TPR) repeat protein